MMNNSGSNGNSGNSGNLWLAILLSVLVLVGFHYFYEKPRIEAQLAARATATENASAVTGAVPQTAVTATATATETDRARAEIIAAGLAAGERITINSARLHGSVNLRGARIDDLTLANYYVSVKHANQPAPPEVVLLSPSGTAAPEHAYFAEFGWLASGSDFALPNASTLWQADRQTLTPNQPVTLTWENGQGLTFERVLALDDNYMFTVTDRVRSTGSASGTFFKYAAIARHATPPTQDLFILHEGPIGVLNGTLHEAKYDDLVDDGAQELPSAPADGYGSGWAGITDKYWLVALVPDQAQPMTTRMQAVTHNSGKGAENRFQVDVRGAAQTLAAGGSLTATTRLFAGAKEVRLLDAYEKDLGIARFDLAVDFGWFYFLTKPFFYALDGIARFFGDTGYGFAIAILLFTVLLKLLFFPLQNKSYVAMNRMKLLQPQMLAIRERFKDDRQKMNMEMFDLYRREKVNPMAGCWPILLQIPVFFALYKVLYVTIEMRHAPFWGWIPDLAAPDPTSLFNLFGLLPFATPELLTIGVWPLLMGLTMYLQQKLAPASPDPTQAMIFRWLPVVFTFMLAHFPAGLVIYWTWSNALSILQQWVLLKRHRK